MSSWFAVTNRDLNTPRNEKACRQRSNPEEISTLFGRLVQNQRTLIVEIDGIQEHRT